MNTEVELTRQREINERLPITSPRNAKWWYSAFHCVTAMFGAGVLSLPYAMSQLGWGPGVVILVLSWIITLYTLWQMVEMHEVQGKRLDRYHKLAQHAFGDKLGLWIVVPQQVLVKVGVNIFIMVTGGKCLKKFHDEVCTHNCKPMKTTYFILIFASVQLVLSHLPSLNAISGISLAATIMAFSYSTITWVASAHKGVDPGVSYGPRTRTTAGRVFGCFSALGEIAFAFAGHSIVPEIQATIPSTPEKPSKVLMWKGVVAAYIFVGLCYLPIALIGYEVFGNKVEDNILISLEQPSWLIAMANLFVVIQVIGSYQVYAAAVFGMIETVLVKKLHFKPSWMLRFISRNFYVGFTIFVAISFPFFGGILGFLGGFVFAPTAYFLPCIMWVVIYKPKRFSLSWCINWICIVLGVLLMVLAPIGALRQIILDAKSYEFYS